MSERMVSEGGWLARTSGAEWAREAPPDDRGDAEEAPAMEGVYIISVAARLLNMHPQTLRKYERLGFIRPSRTVGRLRLYSNEDIAKLRLIKYLVEDLGLNLAGVELAVGLADRLLQLRRQLAAVNAEKQLRAMMERHLEEMLRLLHSDLPSAWRARARESGGEGTRA